METVIVSEVPTLKFAVELFAIPNTFHSVFFQLLPCDRNVVSPPVTELHVLPRQYVARSWVLPALPLSCIDGRFDGF